MGHLSFGHAVVHLRCLLDSENVLRLQIVLAGMSSTSISAHLRRNLKQSCVLYEVRWLSGEGGYLGRGSSYA